MTTEPGLEYRALLPLAWQEGQASPQQIAEWMRENVTALNAIAALEGPTHERELERTANIDHTAARLEAKMDLLLQWVGNLLLAQHPLPPVAEVVLGSKSIGWKCPIALKPGEFGVLSLYLAPRLPMPLMFPVQIQTCSGGQAHGQLLHLSEEAQDGLDRTLFRYHRRALQVRSGRV
jgi:hypothetical protein